MKHQTIWIAAIATALFASNAGAQSTQDIESYARQMELNGQGGVLPAWITTEYPNTFVGIQASLYRCEPGIMPQLYSGDDRNLNRPGYPGCFANADIALNVSALATQNDVSLLRGELAGVGGRVSDVEAQMAASFLQADAALSRVRVDTDRNTTGVAMSFAMAGVGDIAPGETIAISANWGTFGGRNGLAGGFAVRASDKVSFNGGIAFGDKGGAVGGRAGIRFAW